MIVVNSTEIIGHFTILVTVTIELATCHVKRQCVLSRQWGIFLSFFFPKCEFIGQKYIFEFFGQK